MLVAVEEKGLQEWDGVEFLAFGGVKDGEIDGQGAGSTDVQTCCQQTTHLREITGGSQGDNDRQEDGQGIALWKDGQPRQ